MSRIALLLLAACSATRPTPTRRAASVFRVERAAQLVGGPIAEGTVGDWRLENERIAVIVSAIGRPTGFSQSGGNVIDAATRTGGEDELRHVFLYLNDTFPREADYRTATPSMRDGAARLTVRGHDSHAPTIAIETVYEIAPGASTLSLRTRITNAGPDAIAAYRVGDVLQWGATEHFAPGLGTRFKGRREVQWLAGAGERASYGYSGPPGSVLRGEHGSSWSDVTVAKGDLAPGSTIEVVRYLVVGGSGGVGSVLRDLLPLRREPFGTLHGRAIEAGTGRAVSGARIAIHRADGAPASGARSDADGRYQSALPPGEYRVSMDAPGRSGPRDRSARIEPGRDARLDGVLAQGGALDFVITDENGGPLPVKITVLGIAPTADPVLGPRYRAAGAGNIALSADGRGSIALAPGRYRAIATRGLEYDAVEAELGVEPGKPASLRGSLRRVVDTRGFVSADFHQHALPSPDSAVSLRDRVLSNLCAGLEVMVATDHDFITDFSPVIREMGVGRWIRSIPGNEATTFGWGHFNAFPLAPRPDEPRNGAFYAARMTGAEVLSRLWAIPSPKVVQVNHPRAGNGGYLNGVRYDPFAPGLPPEMSTSFHALEILNGKRLEGLQPVLLDWFSLLARGMPVIATGNSDTHAIAAEEAGYPRNFVAVSHDSPERVTAEELATALVERKTSLLSTGPFLRVSIAGKPIGSTVQARAVDVEVETWAAPWVDVTVLEVWKNGALFASQAIAPSKEPLRARTRLRVSTPEDAFLVVIARGDKPLAPYVSTDPGVSATPIAITNPVWVDADGNGRFDPPGVLPRPSAGQ